MTSQQPSGSREIRVLIAKLVVHGSTRASGIGRGTRAKVHTLVSVGP